MNRTLDVWLNGEMTGQLIQDKQGEIHFTYSASWLENPAAVSISCSLPLQKQSFGRKICHAFFGGILPEENQRKLIAKNLGISANNDFSMLEKIGGECAGALSFMPAGETPDAGISSYHKLTDSGLTDILLKLPSRPLLAGEEGVRLSLAGVQEKLAVYVKDGKIFIPLNNAPSTHILKPDFSAYEGVIFNEAFCLNLARKAGLTAVDAAIKKTGDIHYLLIKRYDRIIDGTETKIKKITRLHQEDFCQALAIPSTSKYQNEGGPSIRQCLDLIRAKSSKPVIDLEMMLNAVIFNFLVGNCDAHGKNFSILYSGQFQLAPLYDLICTIFYPDLSQNMAMKLGGEYRINRITTGNFDRFAEEAGFSKPEIRRRILELTEIILSVLPETEILHPVQQQVANLIKTRCTHFSGQAQKNIHHA